MEDLYNIPKPVVLGAEPSEKSLVNLYQSTKYALIQLTVKTMRGGTRIGTGFHIGDGWIATVRHLVEDCDIDLMVSEYISKPINLERVIYPEDRKTDIALIKTDLDLSHFMGIVDLQEKRDGVAKSDHVSLGGHFHDGEDDSLILKKVMILGYPPVPFSRTPTILVFEGEVNAIVREYMGPNTHYIISCNASGGLSGAPVLSEFGYFLGILSEEQVQDSNGKELNFSSVISSKPLFELLYKHQIFPGRNKEIIRLALNGNDDELWVGGKPLF